MTRPIVLVTRRLTPIAQKRLESQLSQKYEVHQWLGDGVMPRATLLDQVKNAHGLLCLITDKIDLDVLQAAGPSLKVVSTMSVGYDHLDVKAIKERGIKIGHTPGVLTDACADLAVALLLSYLRRLPEAQRVVFNGQWPDFSPTWMCGSQLTGKTIGVFGMGRIGRAIAHRIRSLWKQVGLVARIR